MCMRVAFMLLSIKYSSCKILKQKLVDKYLQTLVYAVRDYDASKNLAFFFLPEVLDFKINNY